MVDQKPRVALSRFFPETSSHIITLSGVDIADASDAVCDVRFMNARFGARIEFDPEQDGEDETTFIIHVYTPRLSEAERARVIEQVRTGFVGFFEEAMPDIVL